LSSAKTPKIGEDQIKIHDVYTGRHFAIIRRRTIKKLSYMPISGPSYYINCKLERVKEGSKTSNN
jgi:hypothetical protein